MSKKPEAVRARDLFAKIHRENPMLAEKEREFGTKLVLARNVLRMRIQRGMTQTQLAKAAGITQPRIAEIENARSNPRLDSLERLARAFGTTVESLVKAKHAARNRGASVHASFPLSGRGTVAEGWDGLHTVDAVVRAAGHFRAHSAPAIQNKTTVIVETSRSLQVFSGE